MPKRKRADELYRWPTSRACDSRPINPELERAHTYSDRNLYSYSGSATAGCFYCLRIWEPAGTEIAEFCRIDKEASDGRGNATILCPFCGIDSVITSIDVDPITDELLAALREYWFSIRNSVHSGKRLPK